MERLISLLGLFVFMGIGWLMSNNRRKINWRTVIFGVLLQFSFALLILRTGVGRFVFEGARAVITRLLSFTDYGASFLFGNLYMTDQSFVDSIGGQGPFQLFDASTKTFVNIGTVFVIHILPTIIFFASLMGVLYHLGVMQRLVRGMAWIMTRFMRVSGAESLSAASNIFVGQTEAPLVVAPFLNKMTVSEIMAVMTAGFATVAGGVMAAYVRFGIDPGHLLAASVMSAPAALVMAKLVVPETDTPQTGKNVKLEVKKETANVIDAAASGAASGLTLALNVGAMLMAFIALIAMIDFFLGFAGLSLKQILGYAFYPLAFCMGIDFQDLFQAGHLLGTKIAVNEFVAYVDLASLKNVISARSYTICTYALCGFANFGSIAIQIGGISALAPSRRHDLARLGLRAMFAGALASWMTAAIAGILI